MSATIIQGGDTVPFDELEPGKRHAFDLVAFDRADAEPCTIPIQVLAGEGARPRLVVIAGVHGDEPDGMLALIEASRTLPLRNLRGRLVLVPIAHPPAFAAAQRRSPIDGVDLNRAFPGNPEGTPTERLAHCLTEKLILGADFVFTLHSWYATGTVLPFVEVPDGELDVAASSLSAAEASGFQRIRKTAWPAGLLVRVANGLGVPGMEAEIGDSGASRPENQVQYREHLDRLLAHLGMTPGPTSETSGQAQIFTGQHARSPFAGVLNMVVPLGADVQKGGALAEVTDLRGERVGMIESPAGGTVVSRRSYGSVAVGDIVATVFSPVAKTGSSSRAC